jgi:hypothetical protein
MTQYNTCPIEATYFETDYAACVEFWKEFILADIQFNTSDIDVDYHGAVLLDEGYDRDMIIDSLQEAIESFEFEEEYVKGDFETEPYYVRSLI